MKTTQRIPDRTDPVSPPQPLRSPPIAAARLMRKAALPARAAPVEPMGPAAGFADAINAGVIDRHGDGEVAGGATALVDRAARTPGQPLPDAVRGRFERSLGADLSSVRVHADAAAAEASEALGARAYALGQDIYMGSGQYDAASTGGMALLAHEVAHTVQHQRDGLAAPRGKLEVSEPGDAHEQEADRAAEAIMAGRSFALGGGGGLSRQVIHRDDVPGAAPLTENDLSLAIIGATSEGPLSALYQALNGAHGPANASGHATFTAGGRSYRIPAQRLDHYRDLALGTLGRLRLTRIIQTASSPDARRSIQAALQRAGGPTPSTQLVEITLRSEMGISANLPAQSIAVLRQDLPSLSQLNSGRESLAHQPRSQWSQEMRDEQSYERNAEALRHLQLGSEPDLRWLVALAIEMLPVIGGLVQILEAASGQNLLGQRLTPVQRGIYGVSGVLSLVLPLLGRAGGAAGAAAAEGAEAATTAARAGAEGATATSGAAVTRALEQATHHQVSREVMQSVAEPLARHVPAARAHTGVLHRVHEVLHTGHQGLEALHLMESVYHNTGEHHAEPSACHASDAGHTSAGSEPAASAPPAH